LTVAFSVAVVDFAPFLAVVVASMVREFAPFTVMVSDDEASVTFELSLPVASTLIPRTVIPWASDITLKPERPNFAKEWSETFPLAAKAGEADRTTNVAIHRQVFIVLSPKVEHFRSETNSVVLETEALSPASFPIFTQAFAANDL
jgi:hypothetical protein